jgi:hypothetical protein
MRKTYLADSVYVDYDGYYLVLTTDNGEGPTNTIYLEPAVWSELRHYVERLTQELEMTETAVTQEGG